MPKSVSVDRPICNPWNCPRLVSKVSPAYFIKLRNSKNYAITLDKKNFWVVRISRGVQQTFKEYKKKGIVPDYGEVLVQGMGGKMSAVTAIAFIPFNNPENPAECMSFEQTLELHNRQFKTECKRSRQGNFQDLCAE